MKSNEYPRLVSWLYDDGRKLFTNKVGKECLIKVYLTDEKGEELLKGGKVAVLNQLGLRMNIQDPYFEIKREVGYTPRAMKHRELYRDIKSQYPELERKLTSFESKVMDYGEYVYVDIPSLDNYNHSIVENNDRFYNRYFVHKDKFNVNFLDTLVRYTPTYAFGGINKDYHAIELPAFFSELKVKFPELYQQAVNKIEWLQKKEEKLSLVGKRAKVLSLEKGTVEVRLSFMNTQEFYWNGKVLTNEHIAYDEVSVVEQTIKPTEDTVVKIINNDVVGDRVELVD